MFAGKNRLNYLVAFMKPNIVPAAQWWLVPRNFMEAENWYTSIIFSSVMPFISLYTYFYCQWAQNDLHDTSLFAYFISGVNDF